ncbi:hypothetical protein DFH29DRAFT_601375 [Suillus ampliporus]|nr:hypothetical protein DFH29DRAFT_601375 [Suillus ampliporus]
MIPEIANDQGIGYNTISMNDTANFLAFLEELLQYPMGANLTLSAAVGLAPFFGATGNPATDITGFAKVLDSIAVMKYGIWGPWFSTGAKRPIERHLRLASESREICCFCSQGFDRRRDADPPDCAQRCFLWSLVQRPSLWRLRVWHEDAGCIPHSQCLESTLG